MLPGNGAEPRDRTAPPGLQVPATAPARSGIMANAPTASWTAGAPFLGSGAWNRTRYLKLMRLPRCQSSTPPQTKLPQLELPVGIEPTSPAYEAGASPPTLQEHVLTRGSPPRRPPTGRLAFPADLLRRAEIRDGPPSRPCGASPGSRTPLAGLEDRVLAARTAMRRAPSGSRTRSFDLASQRAATNTLGA